MSEFKELQEQITKLDRRMTSERPLYIAAMRLGNGNPNAVVTAPVSTFYFDIVNDDLYVNVDGVTAWQFCGGSGSIGPHDLLSATHSDTSAAAVQRGDIVTGQGAVGFNWRRLALGAQYTILESDGTDALWTTTTADGETNHNKVLRSSNLGELRIARLGVGVAAPGTDGYVHINARLGVGIAAPGKRIVARSTASADGIQLQDAGGNGLAEIFETAAGDGGFQLNTTVPVTEVRFDSSGDSWITGGPLGVGTNAPGETLHVNGGTDNTPIRCESTDALASIAFVDNGTAGTNTVLVGALSDDLVLRAGGATRATVDSGGDFLINTTTPGAQLRVDQSSTTGAKPVLDLDQADLSEEFINFIATVGAGNPIDTAAVGTYYGKVRVNVSGVGYKYIALYNT